MQIHIWTQEIEDGADSSLPHKSHTTSTSLYCLQCMFLSIVVSETGGETHKSSLSSSIIVCPIVQKSGHWEFPTERKKGKGDSDFSKNGDPMSWGHFTFHPPSIVHYSSFHFVCLCDFSEHTQNRKRKKWAAKEEEKEKIETRVHDPLNSERQEDFFPLFLHETGKKESWTWKMSWMSMYYPMKYLFQEREKVPIQGERETRILSWEEWVSISCHSFFCERKKDEVLFLFTKRGSWNNSDPLSNGTQRKCFFIVLSFSENGRKTLTDS